MSENAQARLEALRVARDQAVTTTARLQAAYDQAVTNADQALTVLKEFGLATIEEAAARVPELDREIETKLTEIEQALGRAR